MRTNREIEFAMDIDDFTRAVAEVKASIANKNGKFVEMKVGDQNDTGIIVVEEDV